MLQLSSILIIKVKNMSGKTSNNKKFIEYSRISNFALCSIAIILVFLPLLLEKRIPLILAR